MTFKIMLPMHSLIKKLTNCACLHVIFQFRDRHVMKRNRQGARQSSEGTEVVEVVGVVRVLPRPV